MRSNEGDDKQEAEAEEERVTDDDDESRLRLHSRGSYRERATGDAGGGGCSEVRGDAAKPRRHPRSRFPCPRMAT